MKKIAGLVLAGGKSSRMGRNKAMLKLPDGATLLSRAFGELAAIYPECRVSCAKNGFYAGFPCIEDRDIGAGVLAGVAAGLEYFSRGNYDAVHVLACDLPMMDAQTLALLKAAHERASDKIWLTAWISERNVAETHAAIYSVECLPLFRERLRQRLLAIKKIIPREHIQYMPYGEDLAPKFFNCNSPGDYLLISKS